MRTTLNRLVFVATLLLIGGCSSSLTEPTLAPPVAPARMIVDDCGDGCAPGDTQDPSAVPYPTYPTDLPIELVRTIDVPNFDLALALYDTSAMSTTMCDVSSSLIDAPDADGQTGPILRVDRNPNCEYGPCADQYIDARADFHQMMAGATALGVNAGSVIASFFLGPAGQGIRVYMSRYGWLGAGTGAYVGWAGYNRWRASNQILRRCVQNNSTWFVHVTILH